MQVNWEAAAAQYDPDIKVASFKTVTLRAVKKVEKAAGTGGAAATGDDSGDEGTKAKKAPAKGKVTAAKKRKAAAEDEDAGSEVEKPAPKKKAAGGKKGKKAPVEADAEVDEGSLWSFSFRLFGLTLTNAFTGADDEIAVKAEGEDEIN